MLTGWVPHGHDRSGAASGQGRGSRLRIASPHGSTEDSAPFAATPTCRPHATEAPYAVARIGTRRPAVRAISRTTARSSRPKAASIGLWSFLVVANLRRRWCKRFRARKAISLTPEGCPDGRGGASGRTGRRRFAGAPSAPDASQVGDLCLRDSAVKASRECPWLVWVRDEGDGRRRPRWWLPRRLRLGRGARSALTERICGRRRGHCLEDGGVDGATQAARRSTSYRWSVDTHLPEGAREAERPAPVEVRELGQRQVCGAESAVWVTRNPPADWRARCWFVFDVLAPGRGRAAFPCPAAGTGAGVRLPAR